MAMTVADRMSSFLNTVMLFGVTPAERSRFAVVVASVLSIAQRGWRAEGRNSLWRSNWNARMRTDGTDWQAPIIDTPSLFPPKQLVKQDAIGMHCRLQV
jgi:hypothetical protein